MIGNDMLEQLMSLGIPNTDVSKSLHVGRALVACWIKCHQPSNVLRKLEDDNEIIQILCQMQELHPNVGFRCTVGHLRAKGLKSKQVRLMLTLKTSKILRQLKWTSLDAEHAEIGVLTLFGTSILLTN